MNAGDIVDRLRDLADRLGELTAPAKYDLSLRRDDGWVILDELRPGAIFETMRGIMAVKTEYRAKAQWYCHLLASGEFAHFAEGDKTLIRELTPVIEGDP